MNNLAPLILQFFLYFKQLFLFQMHKTKHYLQPLIASLVLFFEHVLMDHWCIIFSSSNVINMHENMVQYTTHMAHLVTDHRGDSIFDFEGNLVWTIFWPQNPPFPGCPGVLPSLAGKQMNSISGVILRSIDFLIFPVFLCSTMKIRTFIVS